MSYGHAFSLLNQLPSGSPQIDSETLPVASRPSLLKAGSLLTIASGDVLDIHYMPPATSGAQSTERELHLLAGKGSLILDIVENEERTARFYPFKISDTPVSLIKGVDSPGKPVTIPADSFFAIITDKQDVTLAMPAASSRVIEVPSDAVSVMNHGGKEAVMSYGFLCLTNELE